MRDVVLLTRNYDGAPRRLHLTACRLIRYRADLAAVAQHNIFNTLKPTATKLVFFAGRFVIGEVALITLGTCSEGTSAAE